MSGRKFLYLFLALLLPGLVFVFLKFFGKNVFEVEPLFNSPPEYALECSSSPEFPYHLPDSVMRKLPWRGRDSVLLIVFGTKDSQDQGEIGKQLNRFPEEVKSKDWSSIMVNPSGSTSVFGNPSLHMVYRQCIFLMKTQDNLVVIDRNGRIRGLYNLLDLEDSDRAIAELKIMLELY